MFEMDGQCYIYGIHIMDGCTMLNTWVVGHYCISMDITLHNVLSPLCQVYIGGQHMNEKKHHSSFSALIFFFINQWDPANYDKCANVGMWEIHCFSIIQNFDPSWSN